MRGEAGSLEPLSPMNNIVFDPPKLVVASGCCARCDFRFIDELVAVWADRSAPSGFVFVELRHLQEDGIEVPDDAAAGHE